MISEFRFHPSQEGWTQIYGTKEVIVDAECPKLHFHVERGNDLMIRAVALSY